MSDPTLKRHDEIDFTERREDDSGAVRSMPRCQSNAVFSSFGDRSQANIGQRKSYPNIKQLERVNPGNLVFN